MAPMLARWWYLVKFYSSVTIELLLQRYLNAWLGPLDSVGRGPAAGMNIIVTGPTSGIGRETAATLVRRGANVVLACRSVERGEKLMKQLTKEPLLPGIERPGTIEVLQLDVGSMASVRRAATEWNETGRPLHVLINNAGVMNLGTPRTETDEGLEVHMATNALGPLLLSIMLMPALRKGAADRPDFGARVINVSSVMHESVYELERDDMWITKNYNISRSYGSSKLVQVLWTTEMRRRLAKSDPAISAIAVHPGNVLTEVARTLPAVIRKLQALLMSKILLTPAEGSRGTIFCALDPRAPKQAAATGGYFHSDGRPKQPSPAARQPGAGQWVWEWATKVTQLPPEMQLPA